MFHAFTFETSKLQWLILLFVLVSIADLMMTLLAVEHQPQCV